MDIDQVRINFSDDSLFILNICLSFLIFGVALDIKLSDFKKVLTQPKTVSVGLFSEYILLPILTMILIFAFQPQTSLALGMVLIACCPGGTTSNFMVHFSKSNAALSVLLTSITTIGAIFITPLAFEFWSSFVPGKENLPELSIDLWDMVKKVIQLIFIPVILGIFLNEKYPSFTDKIKKSVGILSLVIFFTFVIGAIIANWEFVKKYMFVVFWIVVVHNSLAFVVGYYTAKLFGEVEANARAISIETGIQNSGLGLILVFNFFDGLGGMAMILAFWGMWHLISGFGLAMWWRRSAQKMK
jgi:BASS family bile acid:Na+ symporter